ncbi:MAG: hypothetical protein KBS52_00980 [Clostridiales bacterium]|nr:hypothetical protein [Candidatus Equinaster intestinalis]
MKNLLILGNGQYGAVVKDMALESGDFGSIAFLDDCIELGTADTVGKLSDYEKFKENYQYAVVAIGNPTVRKRWSEKLIDAGYEIPCMISKYAFVSNVASLGTGIVVEPNATVLANAKIGDGTIVCSGAVINHNATVGEYCQIDCNATVMGGAEISNIAKVEAGKTVYCKQ